MPILENIKVAEAEAEKLRQNAHKEAEDLRVKTKKAAEEEAARIALEADKKIESDNQQTLALIDKLEKENLDTIIKHKAALEAQAKKNQEVGVNYILKQVVEI